MADTNRHPENDPFADLANGQVEPSGNGRDPFGLDSNPSTVEPPISPGGDSEFDPETPAIGSAATGLPFKFKVQTEPIKVGAARDSDASDPFRYEPAADALPTEPTTEPIQEAIQPTAPWHQPDTEAPPPYEPRPDEDYVYPARSGWRAYYDPHNYDRPRSWFTDARIWGTLVAATAVGVVLALVVVLSGSDPDEEVAGVQGEGVEPRAEIQSPAEGQQLPVGQPLEVQGLFAHPDGIARVELQVDGAFVGSVEPEAGGGEPPQTFETAIDWPGPQDPGSHQLLLFAVTASGERIDATLAVNAVVPEGSEAFVEAPEPANVREYPTTDERFPPYGQLQPGERNKILGQLASGEWFLIEFLASPSGQGWVFSQLVTVVGDLATVPVVEDPQIPAATPSSTPTETATPTPTEEVSTEYDIEPRDYQGGFVEIKNNGPGPFSGAITFFYLAADTVDGCQLNTQSGHYTIDDVEIPAGQVLSIGFDEVAPPEGLFCVGIEVEGETDNTNNAIGPYQGPPPAQ